MYKFDGIKMPMRPLIILLLFNFTFLTESAFSQSDSICSMNQKVIQTVEKYGPTISSSYEKAVCTELVIGILKHLINLSSIDKSRIRIITSKDVYKLMEEGSPIPKGVYYALSENGKGIPIDDICEVLPGDFVQFWYPDSWGHCGIVHSLDPDNKIMKLYSSFPSTSGYGIQEFEIPEYCYFVRLKGD